jgi:glycosyltransferase involved in cell wall biosynthesis
VLKVNNAGDRELETLRVLMADRPDIHLITDVLERHEVDSLIAASDAFVSLHRSEGFGLVIAEAMAQGKPVIATGWSGNTDFMSVETSVLVGYQLVELDRDLGPYEAGQRWAEPDLDDAATWMRKLHDDPASGVQMGARAAAAIARSNSPAAVGRVIKSYLATAVVGDDRGLSAHPIETEATQGHASSLA